MRRRDARRRQRAGGGGRAALNPALLAPLLAALLLADHPLAGKAWDVRAGRFIDAAEVERRVAAADVALLGETHDNPRHHELQLRLYHGLVAQGRKPSLALEQLDLEQQAPVDAAIAGGSATAGSLAQAAQVSGGWNWRFYEPLVAVALREKLPIVAINLSRARAREVVKGGLATLDAGEEARRSIDTAWNDERGRELRRVLVESHCGDDSPLIDRMALMQRARDALMADRIAAAPPPTVAILGRGHADAALGVPLYLRERFPERKVLSIAFVEVKEGATAPGDYREAAANRHDIAWFTPRAERDDPCRGWAQPPPAPR